MLSTTASTIDSQSEISSRLSSVPETEALDRIKAELDSAHTDQSNSDIGRRPAKKRRNNQGIDFIEVLTENKRQNAWYWTYGQEWECQKPNKKGKKNRFWDCKRYKVFTTYSKTVSEHIRTHLKK